MKLSQLREQRIQNAIKAIEANPSLSVRETADKFKCSKTTLQARIHGRPPAIEIYESQQRLTPIEEASVVRTIHTMTS
jgi:hypothetical protein